jgi:hypothetical protein
MEALSNSKAKEWPLPPSYCPKCCRLRERDQGLCPECGESLGPSGFCPICEGFVLGPPGSDCPKHDVELLDRPEGLEFDGTSSRLVTIASYGVTSGALGPKLRLEAEGIPTFLLGARMGENSIYQVATGGVKLQVPEEFAADARILLAQSWSTSLDGDDPDDPWEGLAPDPSERRRSVMKVAILIFLFGPAVAVVFVSLLSRLIKAF